MYAFAGGDFRHLGAVGMAHDQPIELRLRSQELVGPGRVAAAAASRKSGFIGGVVAEKRTQPSPPGAGRSRDGACDTRAAVTGLLISRWISVARQTRLGQSVPMDRRDRRDPDLEVEAVRVERSPGLPLPEVAIPAVVISSDHDDGTRRRGRASAAAT